MIEELLNGAKLLLSLDSSVLLLSPQEIEYITCHLAGSAAVFIAAAD